MNLQEACDRFIKEAHANDALVKVAAGRAFSQIGSGLLRMFAKPVLGKGTLTSMAKGVAKRWGKATGHYDGSTGKFIWTGRGQDGWGNKLYGMAHRLQRFAANGQGMYNRGLRNQFQKLDAAGKPIMPGYAKALRYMPKAVGAYTFAAPLMGYGNAFTDAAWAPMEYLSPAGWGMNAAVKGVQAGGNYVGNQMLDAAQQGAEMTANGIADQYGNLGFMERLYGAVNPEGFSNELRTRSMGEIQNQIGAMRPQ